ncbi:sodium:alanine symporter family protein [Demequina sp. NBRC 110057]|uniref:alanine/glycine:cation symporter family protein n=1 Tax=Demequina sp. NBRC 110057 TaxID=1570346 RepID=UPI0009FFC12F|nr:alanine/glycine:cation symporter family protein [Demequina sp. NBRC 110057]
MDAAERIISAVAEDVWWVLTPIVLALGCWFTVRTGVVQVRLFPRMIATLKDRTPVGPDGEPQSLSAFQAFTLSAASRVGIGNIAGVGTAIAVGGPGAVFWMWVMAWLGAASAFIEASLAQLYKHRTEDGFRGGPAYYIQRGLGSRRLAIAFAVILIVSSPLIINSLQAYTIAETVADAVGLPMDSWLPWAVGAVLAALTAAVVFGGARRIARVTESLVPSMALLYLVLGILVIAAHADQILPVLGTIITDAFSGEAVAGGALGRVIVTGIQRGMFSNEAGLGTAPNAAASAATTHPVKQGLVQSLGVYFDTFLVCSITAFIILVATPDLTGAPIGIALTQTAVVSTLGSWSSWAMSLIVFLLAFSTILGLYYYGEANVAYITPRASAMRAYRVLVVAVVLVGCTLNAGAVWKLSDLALAMLALINLPVIALLSRHAVALLRDYREQLAEGRDPVFTRDRLPDARGIDVWEDEESVTGRTPTT